MPNQTMYFGTKERMSWVKCPAINATISKVGWGATGVYLNGGAFVRRSGTGHKEYAFAWNLAAQGDLDTVLDYADGLYGDGLIYFLDPFAVTNNLFPQYWAAPRLASDDAPSLVKNQTPTLSPTAANTINLPTMSATYTSHFGDTFASMYFPIPAGYALNLGVYGSVTGTSQVVVIPDGGATPVVTSRMQLVKNPNSNTTPFTQSGYGTSGVGSSGRVAGAGSGGTYAGVWTWSTAATGGATSHYWGGLHTSDDIPVVAGSVVTGSINAKPSVARSLVQGGLAAVLEFYSAAGASLGGGSGSAVAFTAGQDQRLTATFVVPVGAVRARVGVSVPNHAGTTNGWTLTVSNPMVEVGTVVSPTYVDGSLTDVNASDTTQLHYAWNGPINASSSTETKTVVAGQIAVTPLAVTSMARTNYTLSGVSGATVTFRGSTGSLTLAGMIAQIRPIGETVPQGAFISGKGHSGVRFDKFPVVQGYSAPAALDLVGATATLIETGAWED